MKTTLASILFALSAISAAPAMAANDHAGHGAMSSHHSTAAATKMVDGQVKKIDKAAGKVTLAHGPLANLGMDMPMTMVFRVQNPEMLKGLKAGDRVKFVADRVNGQITIIQMEKAK